MKSNDSIRRILLDIRNGMLGQKKVLSVSDLESYLGLSKSYIYKLTMARKIPHYKHAGGKLIFFKRSEIDDWCLSHKVPSA
jgi:excisionase family DNA binding protein